MRAWALRWRLHAAFILAGIGMGGSAVYLIRPSLPFDPGVFVQSLGVVATLAAVAVALFLPRMERLRKARALRIRVLWAVSDILEKLGNELIRDGNHGPVTALEPVDMSGLEELSILRPHFDLLTSLEMRLLMELVDQLELILQRKLDVLRHRPAIELAGDAATAAFEAINEADPSVQGQAVPPSIERRAAQREASQRKAK